MKKKNKNLQSRGLEWPEMSEGAAGGEEAWVPEVSFDDLQPAFDRQRQRIAAVLAAADADKAAAADRAAAVGEVPTRRRLRLWGLGLTAVLSLAAAVAWGVVHGRYAYDGFFVCEAIMIEVVLVMLFVSAAAGEVAALRHDPTRAGIRSTTRYAQRRRALRHGGHDMAVAGLAALTALVTVACAPSPDRFLSHYDTAAADSLEQILNTI